MSGLAGSCERNNGNLSLLIILREHSNKMSKSSKSFSSSRRTPRRGQQYRPMGSIHESFDNLSMHDSANRAGIDSFLAGTPTKSKRLSQTPKRTGTPRSCLNNPFPRESSHCSYKRDASFSTSNSRTTSTPNRSSDEKPTDTTAKHPIRIVISGVDLSEEDEEKIENELEGEVIRFDKSNPNLDRMTVFVVFADSTTPLKPPTTPFIYAMCKGLPILRSVWLEKSLKNEDFLSTDKYLLKDHGVAENYDVSELYEISFSLSQGIDNGIKASAQGGVLAGHHFVLCSGIGESKAQDELSRKELKVLLQAAGAQPLTTKDLRKLDGDLDNFLVVTSTIATDEQVELANRLVDDHKATSVTCELVTQILLKQSLDPLEKLKAKEQEATENKAAFNFVPGPTKELFKTKMINVSRTLSRPNQGDTNRGKLGEGGTLSIVESTFQKYVQYFNQDGILVFKACAPSKSDASPSMFGNAGRQDCVVWEAVNEAGYQSGEFIHRRFFFFFLHQSDLDSFLVFLFGIDIDPAKNQTILQEWYDEGGRFYQEVPDMPAHDIIKDENEMEDEFLIRKASKPVPVVVCEYGCNVYAATQTQRIV